MNRFLTIIILLASQAAWAQSITSQNISWQVSKTEDVNSGEFMEVQEQIISYGTEKIEWRDRNNNIQKTFIINEVNGTWSNIQTQGSVIFEVDYEGKNGTVTFQRTGSELTVKVLLLRDDELPEMYELTITNYSVI